VKIMSRKTECYDSEYGGMVGFEEMESSGLRGLGLT
jgi:hypothetical protein